MAEIKKINTELQPIDKLLDTSGDAGTSGQILSSTGSGTNWIANTGGGGTVTGNGAATRVTFWSDTTVLSSTANFYWDNTNERLIIGTTAAFASSTLTLNGNQSALAFSRNTGTDPTWTISSDSSKMYLSDDGNSTYNMVWVNDGKVGIGTVTPTSRLHINGTGATHGEYLRISNGTTQIYELQPSIYNVTNNGFGIYDVTDSLASGVTVPIPTFPSSCQDIALVPPAIPTER